MSEMLANANVLQVAAGMCCIILSLGIAGYMIGMGAKGKSVDGKDDK